MDVKKDLLKEEDGQAIFEFIVFLPFFIFFFTLLITFGNSINGSINQQKAVRRYTYFLLKGNSTFPMNTDLRDRIARGITQKGDISIGWREKSEGEVSFGTCYKMNTLFSSSDKSETCDEPVGEGKSNFVRVFTFYGICGQSYVVNGNAWEGDFGGMGKSLCGQGN